MPVELPAGVVSAAGVDVVARSVTVKPSGPYTSLLADGVTPTPAGWGMLQKEVTATDPYHALAYGIKADGQFVSDGVMNGTTAVLTSASGLFKSTDVGKLCLVPGAGAAGALLNTTIASYQSATQVTLAAVSQTAVSGGTKGAVTWGTNDSAAWVALYAIAPVNARIIIPQGYSLYKGSFMGGILKSLSLEGLGSYGLRTNTPQVFDPDLSPYVAGSVIVQCQAASNGIDITGTADTVHRRNFAIKFADGIAFLNTGHGIFSQASTLDGGGGHQFGEMYSRSDTIIVHGHDGNHYAAYYTNPCGIVDDMLCSYGGGVLHLGCDSTVGAFGNSVFTSPYGGMFCGGTAHGYDLVGTAAFPGDINLLTFTRPQVNIESIPTPFTGMGIAAVTVAQYRWKTTGPANSVLYIGITDPDLENGAGVNCPVDFGPTRQVQVRGGGFIASPAPTGGYPIFFIGNGLNANATLQVQVNNTNMLFFTVAPNQQQIQLQPQSITGLTAETVGVAINPSTNTLAGSYASQSFFQVATPTYNGAFTITDAASVQINFAPNGTATFTRKYPLWIRGTERNRYDTTTGVGNGALTNMQAPAFGTGSGPANPLAVVAWIPQYWGTAVFWVPGMQ